MNKKWLIGIVVVVVLGILTYVGTSTDLFTGAFRYSKKGGEKGGIITLPKVTKERCEIFKKYYNENGYSSLNSDLIKNKPYYWLACKNAYPNMPVNYETCQTYKYFMDIGTFTQNGFNMTNANECAKYFEKLWFDDVSKKKCKLLKHWLDNTVLTPNLANGGSENHAYEDFNICVNKYAGGNASGTWKF